MGSDLTWIDACRLLAATEQVDEDAIDALDAFRGPMPRGGEPPPPERVHNGAFESFERSLESPRLLAVADDLAHEVDEKQARMFQRRLTAVDNALAELGDATGRVLRVGLRHRAGEIMTAARPRALRIRALADFYYSAAARVQQRRRGVVGRPIEALVVDARFEEVAPGVDYAGIEGETPSGPQHVNVLRIDPGRARIEAFDCRDAVKQGVPFAEVVRTRGAIAGFSGGFFLYSEPDIAPPSQRHDPVALLVSEGRVLSPPVFRRGAVLIDADGRPHVRRIGLVDATMTLRGRRLDGARATTRAQAREGRDVASVAVVGTRVCAIGHALPVPLNGFVVPYDGPAEIGDEVEFGAIDGLELRSAVAGGPMLRHGGRDVLDMRAEDFWGTAPPVTFSQDETGDRNLLPRLAAGLDDAGHLVVAAIDGRNVERALGMTLRDVTDLMTALGCHTATNLDGGSSKRFVLNGETKDLPSTEITAGPQTDPGVRPVYTSLMVLAREF